MQNIKKPTWVTGDGTLFVDSLTVLVKRDFAQPLPIGEPASNREVHDRWIISATHLDGRGEKVTTNVALDHQFYDGKSTTVISKVSNSLGAWKGKRFFGNLNLESDHVDCTKLPPADACLSQLIKALYDANKVVGSIECTHGTPIPLSEGEDGIFFNEVKNARIALVDARKIYYADVGQALVESLARDNMGLTVRMNSSQASNVDDRIAHALRLRHEDIGRFPLPDGVPYSEFLKELVEKGLSLGPFEDESLDMESAVRVDAPHQVSKGTTCLLAEAIDRNDIHAITALMSQGADPLLPLMNYVEGDMQHTSPLKKAVLNGQVESLLAVLNNARTHDAPAIVEAFKNISEPKGSDVCRAVNALEAKLTIDRMSKGQHYAPC